MEFRCFFNKFNLFRIVLLKILNSVGLKKHCMLTKTEYAYLLLLLSSILYFKCKALKYLQSALHLKSSKRLLCAQTFLNS